MKFKLIENSWLSGVNIPFKDKNYIENVNNNIISIQNWDYSKQFEELKEQLKEQSNFSWKTVICFVWAPWAWKTTQKKLLKDRINPNLYHMSGFVKSLWKKDFANNLNAKWELITGYENQFLDSVAKSNNAFTILDWFPRSEEQVILLYRKALEMWWEVKTICLDFDEDGVKENSLNRQKSRAEVEWKWETNEKREAKLKRYFQKDKKAILALEKISIDNFTKIDANNDIQTINEIIESSIWINYLEEKFDREILEKVLEAEKETWIEMWLWAGLVYRHYFNWKYWPVRDSFDKDIHVSDVKQVEKALNLLENIDSNLRWSVDSRFQDTAELYWIESKSMQEAMTTFPLTFRQVGIKLNQDWKLSIMMSSQAKYDLENGIIRIDEELLSKIPENQKQSFLDRAVSRANKVIQEYPWLKLEWIIKVLYKERYLEHNNLKFSTDIEWILESINDIEFWGKQIWRKETINEEQKVLMQQVVDFYKNTKPEMQIVKYPNKWKLPYPWDKMLKLKQKKERWEKLTEDEEKVLSTEHIPEWYNSSLDYVLTLCDAEFTEWFLNQVRSRKPLWWKDEFLDKIMQYMKDNVSKEQKPTHLGLPLYLHSIDVVWQLETDELSQKLSTAWYSQDVIISIRKSMRIAMFLHDIWKTKNSLTPWCHEWVWVKIWEKLTPDWIKKDEKDIISWIIWIHDVFWRLARSITEKSWKNIKDNNFNVLDLSSYKWAIDPKEASNMIKSSPLNNYIALEVAKEIWRADVSSVSSLKWILWVSDKLFQIVDIEMNKI